MANCLQDNEGAIGYIDAAHGHEALLTEIRLSNADGRFLTSKDAGDEGVQQAAVDLSDVPDSADGDFSEVAFYNMVCSYCCLVWNSLGYRVLSDLTHIILFPHHLNSPVQPPGPSP